MLNTTFTLTGARISHQEQWYTVKSAGVRNDEAYATVDPPNDVVVSAIVASIDNAMPHPPTVEQIQAELNQRSLDT